MRSESISHPTPATINIQARGILAYLRGDCLRDSGTAAQTPSDELVDEFGRSNLILQFVHQVR